MKEKPSDSMPLEKRRRMVERTASFGLLLVCAALVAPFAISSEMSGLAMYKWIYAAGALVFLVARLVGATDPGCSPRLRRIRRMEFWAGVSFGIGAVLWFYTENRVGQFAGPLAVLRSTILFTLVGAAIQVISAQLGYSVEKKEKKKGNE